MKILILAVSVLMAGCTTLNGISKAEKPGEYYITKNSHTIVGIMTSLVLCKTNETGDLKCHKVNIDGE